MSKTSLVWSTPNGDQLIAYMARVSNPANQGAPAAKLIRYLIRHKHWSPFEMASMCVEINTERDISRQIIRHRSLHFQEFSQRYQQTGVLPDAPAREVRMQDHSNRQNSLPCTDYGVRSAWAQAVKETLATTRAHYDHLRAIGVANEVARAVLPEGLTPTRMYVAGTLRSWIHYFDLRCDDATQKEHREVACEIRVLFALAFPQVYEAVCHE